VAVRVERSGPVTTVVLDRPERRNAVDGVTAQELAEAFRGFDTDAEARVAVLWGAGGTFCAGADLKAIATATGNRLDRDGDGPMGPTRMLLSKPPCPATRSPADSSWPSGVTSAWSRRTPSWASSVAGGACRSWMAARCVSRG
jgi:enoyl-CoA hydratase